MPLTFQPVRVETGGPDDEGQLVFVNDKLAALLVRLSADHEGLQGCWFLEAGFGRLDGPIHPTFVDLDAATEWMAQRLAYEPLEN